MCLRRRYIAKPDIITNKHSTPTEINQQKLSSMPNLPIMRIMKRGRGRFPILPVPNFLEKEIIIQTYLT